MKLRNKIIFAEMIFSIILLLALFLSVAVLLNHFNYKDFLVQLISLRQQVEETRVALSNTLYESSPSDLLLNVYKLSHSRFDEQFRQINKAPYFSRLPHDVQDLYYTEVDSHFRLSETLTYEKLKSYLQLRSQHSTDTPKTLFELQQEGTVPGINDIFTEVLLAVQTFNSVNYTIERVTVQLLSDGKAMQKRLTFMSAVIPAIILLLALSGITVFWHKMGQKISLLDKSLRDIAQGNFSLRVQIRGNDEFSSFAESINTFTQNLGSKMESFRSVMEEVGQTLTTTINSQQVEDTLVHLAIQDTSADGAAIYKVIEESGGLMLSAMAGKFRPPYKVQDLPDDPDKEDINAILRSRIIQPRQTVIGTTASTGQPVVIRNTMTETSLDWMSPPENLLFISSLIAVPLQIGSTVFGVLVITSSKKDQLLSDLEYVNMQSFGELCAITLDNIYKYSELLEASRLNREIGIAEEIQQELLPDKLPRIPCGKMAFLSRSIKGMNADYFDAYPIQGNKTLITVCKVAGRGVPAGLIMVMIRTVMRLLAPVYDNALDILTQLNQSMTRRIAVENYAEVSILVFDCSGNYSFSSAASYPLQIFHSESGHFETVKTKGIPVGVDKKAEYTQETGQFQKGDIVLLHSDGIPESRNREGKILTVEKLQEIIKEAQDKDPDKLVETLNAELEYFERGTQQKEDQTAVILNYTGRVNS